MLPLLLALSLDLTGTWMANQQGPGGRMRESLFTFRKEQAGYSGSSSSPIGTSRITDIALDGDKISFVVRMTLGGEERPLKWSGQVEGEELVLRIQPPAGFGPPGGLPPGAAAGGPPPFGPGGPPPGGPGPAGPPMGGGPFGGLGELRFRKLSAEEVAKREAARPKPMPLPEKRVLPWNSLAPTPPMGWNSYNKFRNNVTDAEVRQIADAMVSSGMKAAGYEYVVVDDGWQGTRDSSGRMVPNSRFPDMKALADYVHSKGLKIGLWATPGPQACNPNFAGSFGHEKQDAEQWAEWGIDYIKFDWCTAGGIYSKEQQPLVYQKQAELMRATGRPMVLSICQYGDNGVQEWGAAAGGNLWRTTFDIFDTWESMSRIGFRQSEFAAYSRPGHWNDPDMLEVGNGGMTDTEYRTHFSLWAMAAAPLMAGNDVRSMSEATREILLNREVIAVNQDKLGKGGRAVTRKGETEVWTKPLEGGGVAVALFNRGAAETQVTAEWADIGLSGPRNVRDVWKHADLGTMKDRFTASVPSHGVVMVVVR